MEKNSFKNIKVCHVVSADLTLEFLLLPLFKFFQNDGYEVCAVSSPGKWIKDVENKGVSVKQILIKRKFFTPFSDLKALVELFFYFKSGKINIVHTHTPKAGFLGRVAAKLAGVPVIIHTNHGFHFQDSSATFKKNMFVLLEKIGAGFCDEILSINKEDIETAVKYNICRREKIKYSGDGINIEVFNPGKFTEEFVGEQKNRIGIRSDGKVIGFVGRLVEEKGILDLVTAMTEVRKRFSNAVLLVVGPEDSEKKDAVSGETFKDSGIKEGIIFLGERIGMQNIYPLMDVFVLPSHREGLGLVILEASAMEKPVVATNIRGCREAVDDGKTGILVPIKNPGKLAEAILYLLNNPSKAEEMGKNGRMKVAREFDEKLVFGRIKESYEKLIESKLHKTSRGGRFRLALKRFFDMMVSLLGLILLSPIFLIVAALIKADSEGPVFFRQERIGKDGKPFYPLKFRTMVVGAVNKGLGYNVAENDERITKIGKFLRKYGMDEFPQLINILKGEMSIVGPRPTLRYQVEKYNDFEKRRLLVKPGLAGWAMIHGRNSLTWEERIKYDVWYVENWSLWLDIKIIFKTFYLIFIKQEGVYGKGGINDPFNR